MFLKFDDLNLNNLFLLNYANDLLKARVLTVDIIHRPKNNHVKTLYLKFYY